MASGLLGAQALGSCCTDRCSLMRTSLALLPLSSRSPIWGWPWEFSSTCVQTRGPTRICVTSVQSLNLTSIMKVGVHTLLVP